MININIEQLKIIQKTKYTQLNNLKNDLKPFISKVCKYDFFSMNEINICEKIKDMSYYYNYFLVLHDYDFIKVGQLGEKMVEDLDIIDFDYNLNNKDKYLLLQYKNLNTVDFKDFLFNQITPKQFILHVLQSFYNLLDRLSHLNDNNICYFDLSPDNIVFDKEKGYNLLLQNFQNSIYISKLNELFICKLIPNITDFTHKPLEVHVLFYLIKNNLDTLTNEIILIITERYIENLSILSLFSESYKDKFKIGCIDRLTKYINKPKSDIICNIIENNESWDSYSVSIIYLHIIGTIVQVFDLKGTFLSKMTIELMKNIHPNPVKRNNITTIKTNYNALFEEFDDWSFIHKIPEEKMVNLIDTLR